MVKTDERPNWIQTIAYGIQHVLAMFSGTVLIPALFFSGISTIIFFIVTRGRVPSYLGSSGSFVSAVCAVTGYVYSPSTFNENMPVAQGGILILGIIYVAIAIFVLAFGHAWLEFLMPPIVTGAIVSGIGLHLAFSAFTQATSNSFDTWMAVSTVLIIMLLSVYAPLPSIRRMQVSAILLGMIIGYVINLICGLKGAGPAIDYTSVSAAPWVRGPTIHHELVFDSKSISTIAPLIVVVLAENLGHLKALSSMTEKPMEKYLGAAYLGDALSTIMASFVGAPPMTTYAENIGVVAITRIFSPVVFLVAAIVAIILGCIAKFGAVVHTIPPGVFGGVAFVLYTIIGVTGVRIWVINEVDFFDSRNIFVGGIPLMLAATIQVPVQMNNFQLDGIGAATFSSIILYHLLQGTEGWKNYGKAVWRVCRRPLNPTSPV
ncbi:Xanthine/uracil/vitamin C permease [Phycomyces blakesleeanus]